MAEDPRIAAFARANRRRNAVVLASVGVLLVIGGAILLAVLLAQPVEVLGNDRGTSRYRGGGYQLIVVAGGIIVVGLATIAGAYRLARSKPEASDD